MNRLATIGAIAAVTAAGLSAAPAQAATQTSAQAVAQKPSTTKTDPHFTPSERASTLRAAKSDATATTLALRLPGSELLRPTDALADTSGALHVRYDRTYEGLRVVGGDMVVHQSPAGTVTSVDYASKANLAVRSTTPRTHAPSDDSTLVVFAANHKPVLAWESRTTGVETDGGAISRLTYTDANTGKRITSWSTISHADGTGSSLYSGSVPLKTCSPARRTSSRTPPAAAAASMTPTTQLAPPGARCSPMRTTRGATAAPRRDRAQPSMRRTGRPTRGTSSRTRSGATESGTTESPPTVACTTATTTRTPSGTTPASA